jgi:hypothetical protein
MGNSRGMWVRRALGLGALAGVILLMTLNVAGLHLPISEHPIAQHTHVHKASLGRPSYEAALQALSRIDPTPRAVYG